MKRVAILDDYQGVAMRVAPWEILAGRAEVIVFRDPFVGPSAVVKALADFEVLVLNRERTPLPAAVIDVLPKLELIVTSGMRNAVVDMTAARSHGIVVSGTETLGYPTVELTWALILGLARHLPEETMAMRQGGWQTTIGVGLCGKTLGVMGLGRIGREVARVGAAFGMRVIAWSPSLTPERAQDAGATLATRDELLATSDVLTLHMPLTASTFHVLDAAAFAAMKPTALLVNTSRGPIVDEAALVAALSANMIRGAALDVYSAEPLPAEHPLRTLSNVIATPHLGYVIEENYQLGYGQAVENIWAWLVGAPLRVIGSGNRT